MDKYTWVDIGSSYLPGEIVAAFLWAQLEQADAITARHLDLWATYHDAFAALEDAGKVRRPIVPSECRHNGHLYGLVLPSLASRTALIDRLKARDIQAVFHYVPLHSSPYGRSMGRTVGEMTHTVEASERLVRLPMWLGLEDHMDTVIAEVLAAIGSAEGP